MEEIHCLGSIFNKRPVLNAMAKWICVSALITIMNYHSKKMVLASIVIIVLLLGHFLINRCRSDENLFMLPVPCYVIGAIASYGLLIQFYYCFADETTYLQKAADFLRINQTLFTHAVPVMLGVLATPGTALVVSYLNKVVFNINKKSFEKLRCYIKPFCILSALNLTAYISIFRANYNYVDDAGRVLSGYRSWNIFSRFISNCLSTLVHANSFLADISPLPQLLAVLLLALSEVIVLYAITGKDKFNFWDYCAVLPLSLSPYYLECISYKYDSPYMALSVLAAVVPALYFTIDEHRTRKLFISSLLCTLIVCMTYQAALGILPMLVIAVGTINLLLKKRDKNTVFSSIAFTAAGYLTAVVFFRFVIMLPADNYVSNAVPGLDSMLSTVATNYIKYIQTIMGDFNAEWTILVAGVSVGFIICVTCASEEKKTVAFLITCAAFVVSALLMFGVYPVLSAPLYSPRAMYGFGAWIAFLGLVSVSFAEKHRIMWLQKFFVLALAWSFFTFSFTYGNVLSSQKEYTKFRESEVLYGINSVYKDSDVRELHIEGSAGFAPAISNTINKYPVLSRLVPSTFSEGWDWGGYDICNYYGVSLVLNTSADSWDELPVLIETESYTLKGNKTRILVELH